MHLPTIFTPSPVRRRTTCIFELCPVFAAKTFSTRDQTLNTEPANTLYVLRRSPTSQSKPSVTFLQLPRLSTNVYQSDSATSERYIWQVSFLLYTDQYAWEHVLTEELYCCVQCGSASSVVTFLYFFSSSPNVSCLNYNISTFGFCETYK
jgi:hypothetical protein